MTQEKEQEIRRNIGEARNAGLSGMTAELAARFVAERFADAVESYRHEWYNRFQYGNHWHKMDNESHKVFLTILTTEWGGTARCISKQTIQEWLE